MLIRLEPAGSNADAPIVAEERIIYTLHLLKPATNTGAAS